MAYETKNILINTLHDRAVLDAAQKHLHGRLIDIGCGTKPFAARVAPYVNEHVGVDHEASLHDLSEAELIGSAYEIPAEDETFDSALCTAVLEHLEEPQAALRECNRLLKPGGTAVYTVPFIWHLHEEPRDFYRYSKFGLQYLFERAGFDIVEIRPLSGFWVTFGQLLVYNMYRFNRGILRWLGLVHACGLAVQGGAYLLDRFDRAERWTWMYLVVAKKKEDGE